MRWKESASVLLIFIIINVLVTSLALCISPKDLFAPSPPIIEFLNLSFLLDEFMHLIIGLAAFSVSRNIKHISLGVFFTLILDVDHWPFLIWQSGPVRPAHSFFFDILLSLVVWVVVRRKDFVFILNGAFFAHLAYDATGFPLFSPLSYEIINFSNPLLIGVICFLIAIIFAYLSVKVKTSSHI